MGEKPIATTSIALHAELCAAIADLAKSVDIAVARTALRSQCTAAIADAAKAAQAADALRAAATGSILTGEQKQVSRATEDAAAEKSSRQDNGTRDVQTSEAVEELYGACSWLTTTLAPDGESGDPSNPAENAIAMRILELRERLVGPIKY